MLEKEETATKPLFEIRHLLVVAAQKEYDARIARGLHPYSMASYQFENFIHNELNKHISDTHEWKSGDWRKFQASKELYKYKVHLGLIPTIPFNFSAIHSDVSAIII